MARRSAGHSQPTVAGAAIVDLINGASEPEAEGDGVDGHAPLGWWGEEESAQALAGLPIAIAVEIGVPLTQQLLSPGIGAELLAAVAMAAGGGAIGNHSVAAPPAEIPGTKAG